MADIDLETDPLAGYTDKKKYFWMLSVVWPLVPTAGIYLVAQTGWEIFYGLMLVVWYLGVPLLDAIFGEDYSNPPEEAVAALEQQRYYRILTYAAIPLFYITLLVSAWWISTHDISITGIILLALSQGIVGALALTTGHELGHKKESFDRWMAKIALAVVGYGHFFIEHNKGHHRDVATPEDPASARMGETVYRFVKREIPGAFKRAWRLELERLERRGENVWSLQNEIIQPMIISVVLYSIVLAFFGPKMLLFIPIQMAFSWFQLTMANYIEHYGLLREKLPNGRYQLQEPKHSWNSNHIVSNLILFHLQRHSDHHAHPTRSYQSLRDFKNLPALPTGYPGMFLLLMVPKWYRSVMDPKVVAWADGDLDKIHMEPDMRDYYERKFGKSDPDIGIATAAE
jgi:alkane 1-monooxygenase